MGEIAGSLLVDVVYNTNRIEGSPLSRAETEQIVDAIIKEEDVVLHKPLRYGVDVYSWMAAWQYASTLIHLPTAELTSGHILKIHGLLTLDHHGFRSQPNQVVILHRTKVLLARPEEVRPLMERLITWLHDELRMGAFIVDVVINFHAYFVRIHPFADGNG